MKIFSEIKQMRKRQDSAHVEIQRIREVLKKKLNGKDEDQEAQISEISKPKRLQRSEAHE